MSEVLVRAHFGLTRLQVLLLPLVLGAGLGLLLATVRIALVSTLGLFLLVTFIGLWRCRVTARTLADTKLRALGTLWLVKVGLTVFLLYAGWIPQLDPASSGSWGYDPQRFYQDAHDLIENDWRPTQSTNYQGIIYYYGAVFYLLGHNPVIPALVNAFVTLLGTLFLIRVAYEFKAQRGPRDWTLAYLLLIPEFVWYDVMTSREPLAAVLVLVSTLSFGRSLVGSVKVSLLRTALVGGACLAALLAVRTSMAIPVAVSVIIVGLFLQSRLRFSLVYKVLITVFAVGLLLLGPLVQQVSGGYDINYYDALKRVQSFEDNVASGAQWSDRSLGLLIAPNNAWQALLYLPPRMVLYLAAPLPNIAVSLGDLFAGSWSAWQRLMTIPTSGLLLLGLPYALAAASLAWRQRLQYPAPMVLHISFWITFIAVAGGNIVIHERYRLMFSLLCFTCIWLGYTSCSRRQVIRWAYPWFSLLGAGAVFYMSFKLLG